MRQFRVWQTIRLGTDQPTDPADELERRGFMVSVWGRQLLAKTAFASEPSTVDLVRVAVAELGLTHGVTTKEIFDRAAKLGLNLLPAEAGYRLRIALKDQPIDEWLFIGMDPIEVPDSYLSVFLVDPYYPNRQYQWLGGQWLGGGYAPPRYKEWVAGNVWVFGAGASMSA